MRMKSPHEKHLTNIFAHLHPAPAQFKIATLFWDSTAECFTSTWNNFAGVIIEQMKLIGSWICFFPVAVCSINWIKKPIAIMINSKYWQIAKIYCCFWLVHVCVFSYEFSYQIVFLFMNYNIFWIPLYQHDILHVLYYFLLK